MTTQVDRSQSAPENLLRADGSFLDRQGADEPIMMGILLLGDVLTDEPIMMGILLLGSVLTGGRGIRDPGPNHFLSVSKPVQCGSRRSSNKAQRPNARKAINTAGPSMPIASLHQTACTLCACSITIQDVSMSMLTAAQVWPKS